MLYQAVKADERAEAACGVDFYGDTTSYEGIPVYKRLEEVKTPVDVLVDFSSHTAIYDILPYAINRKIPCVLATTGYADQEKALIKEASEKIPIFTTGNMSVGVNVMKKLVGAAARMFGDKADIEIIESHHNQKADAPSGTALLLFDAIKEARPGLKPAYCREGLVGKRSPGEVGFHSIRGGTIVGKHEVMFIMDNEIFTIKHEAESRAIFANGAINAAVFIKDKENGLYSMKEMLEN